MSSRTTTTTVIAREVRARRPRQPAMAIVMSASAPTIVMRIGARHRSMTE
jgi:deoxyadenosine/deoxycytidine kinase